MAKLTKKQKALEGKVDALKLHAVDEAIKTVRELATAKFDETLEIAMNLGVDPRHADQMVRGVVTLPPAPARMSRSPCSRAATMPTRRWPPAPTRSGPKT